MNAFSQRSSEKEMLDAVGVPFEAIRSNMQELDIINTRLGGHAITIEGLRSLLPKHPPSSPLHVVEIGCGGGDNLRALHRWTQKHQIPARFTGIDINEQCIAFARSRISTEAIEFIHSDYREARFSTRPSILFSSLFCHHFTDEELAGMLQWMLHNSSLGFFINDLHRHPLAYHSIRLLTSMLSRSEMVKHDAPLSVKRGFVKREWKDLLQHAGISSYQCKWKWAFRWLVTVKQEAHEI